MIYKTAQDWRNAKHKRIMLFGMSGLGKTFISEMLRDGGDWFHYSVDYRIGTRYLGEHIVDNFKREAMRQPFLRELLRSDSIYIASNLTFNNLSPLSTFLGKPGDPDKGGIPFEEYLRRQRLHREAEIAATLDTIPFMQKALDLYDYEHFVCDTSGSVCEVVEADDPNDPVMSAISAEVLPVWIEGRNEHTNELVRRFDRAPKPMYYRENELHAHWERYCSEKGLTESDVDPDDFIRYGYRRQVEDRLPRYAAIAKRWGVTVQSADVEKVKTPEDFEALIERAFS